MSWWREGERWRARAPRVTVALVIAALGAALFALLGLPLPWLIGALVATTLASFAGVPQAVPGGLRQVMIAVLGVMLGTAFTPERLEGALAWLPSLATLPLYVVTVGGLIFLYLLRFAPFDRTTAFFAATPGGMSEMIALSDQLGGDQRAVALIQATRLLFIVSMVPFLAQGLGVPAAQRPPVTLDVAFDLWELGLLAAVGVVGYLLAARIRLPAASFVGPLIGSTIAHLAGWIETEPPFVIMAAAQLVMGASVGARFSGTPFRLIVRALALGAGGTMLMLVITLAFGAALHALTGLSLGLLLLAFMPGGFTEMSLIALAMGVDPAFVVTHHSCRVFLVILIALPGYGWLSRSGWLGRGEPASRTEPAD